MIYIKEWCGKIPRLRELNYPIEEAFDADAFEVARKIFETRLSIMIKHVYRPETINADTIIFVSDEGFFSVMKGSFNDD